MSTNKLNLLLADDDDDDCIFFKEALEELPVNANLTIVNNGEELMRKLTGTFDLPDILFLDLNMPLKTGYECLAEIKKNQNLKHLPVIVFSTSNYPEILNWLYEQGACRFIRKPGTYSKLREIIHLSITTASTAGSESPARENFILSNE